MTDFNFDLKVRNTDKPMFGIIYGPSGVGKTTLPTGAEGLVVIQTEDGAGELALPTLKDGIFTSFEEVMAAIRYIYKNADENGYKTLMLDSLDHLEPLVWKHVCEQKNWESIESPGFGRGYVEADKYWMELINALILLRDRKNVTIICIAHDIVRNVNDPMTGPYDAHELKMHKRATALWKEKSDLIGLLKNPVVSSEDKSGKSKGKGGTTPTLYVRPNAAYTAKTRYLKMPSFIQIPIVGGWEKITQYIPFYMKKVDEEVKETVDNETA